MMKGITVRFFRLAALGKLAIVILSLMGFVSVVNAYNDNSPEPTSSQTKPTPQIAKAPDPAPEQDIVSEVIPYSTITVENPSLEKGKTRIRVQGVNGLVTSIYYRLMKDGVEVSRLHVSTEVTTEPVTEIVEVGMFAATDAHPPQDGDQGPITPPIEEEPVLDPTPIEPPIYCVDSTGRYRIERRICEQID